MVGASPTFDLPVTHLDYGMYLSLIGCVSVGTRGTGKARSKPKSKLVPVTVHDVDAKSAAGSCVLTAASRTPAILLCDDATAAEGEMSVVPPRLLRWDARLDDELEESSRIATYKQLRRDRYAALRSAQAVRDTLS